MGSTGSLRWRPYRASWLCVLSVTVGVLHAGDRRSIAANLPAPPRRAGFEVNRGQWPAAVRFVARDGEATLFLTADEAVWRLDDPISGPAVLRLRWLGANRHPVIFGAEPLPRRVNYVRSSAPRGWFADVPLHARVAYRDLYPGIDLVFHDERGNLEYDLLVAPGVDPRLIRLGFDGAEQAEIDASGRLLLRFATAAIIQPPPVAYQDTPAGRRLVSARYHVRDEEARHVEVAFELGDYDAAVPLVIDPSVSYLTEIDNSTDSVVDVAVDGAGNLWMVGTTANPQFPVTDDALEMEKSSLDDGYVVKLDAQGQLVYATYLGGSFFTCMGGADVDADGNVYVTGITQSADCPVTKDALQTTPPGGQGDAFLTKLDANGQLLYSTYFGGTGSEECTGSRTTHWARVRGAADGSFYMLIALTTSLEFPVPGGTRSTLDGDAFLAYFGAGMVPVWGRFIGGSASDFGAEVVVDEEGNAYVYGTTSHIFGQPQDFPTTAGAFQEGNDLDTSHFVARFSAAGDRTHATLFGPPSGADSALALGDLAVDAAGNVYIAVPTGSDGMPATAGSFQPMLRGFSDLFVASLDPTLSTLRYATYLGGSGAEQATGGGLILAVNDDGNAYVGGVTQSSDYPQRDPLPGVASDQVLTKLAPDGAAIGFSSPIEVGTFSIALGDEAIYVGGQLPVRSGVAAIKIDERCLGDCDRDRHVGIDELVIGVNIALQYDTVDTCPSFDLDDDGSVGIVELVGAVRSANDGCL
jgi:hypothetical protein